MTWPRLEQALTRFREIEQLLADPAVIADRGRFSKLAREHGALRKLVTPYLEFQKVDAELGQAQALRAAESDPALQQMIEEELAALPGAYAGAGPGLFTLAPGGSTTFGFIASWNVSNPLPAVTCTVT